MPRGVIALVICASGCGRIGFDSQDAGPAPHDCWAGWRAGAPVINSPHHIDELATDAIERNPSMGANKIGLVLARGPMDNRDLFIATRTAVGAPFGTPTAIEPLDSAVDDTRLSVSADGLVAELASIRNGTDYDLFEARRATTSATFGPPSAT